jgi:hypothetical protein
MQTGSTIFGVERAIGRDWVRLDSNADIRVSLGSNGDITMLSNAVVCGDIRYGIGKTLSMSSNARQCAGYTVTQENRDLPQMSDAKLAQVRTTNSNSRFFAQDIRTSSSEVTWDPASRSLFIGGSSTLTMGGTDYLLCKLTIDSNGGLIMAAGSNVRIYFDTPEACGLSSGALQVELKSNSYITSTAYDPSQGLFNVPGLYLFGSPSQATSAYFGNNTNQAVNEFVLYAPNTDVQLDSNAIYTGAIAGKTLDVKSNATIVSHANMVIPGLDIPPQYSVERYVECTGATATPPDANC